MDRPGCDGAGHISIATATVLADDHVLLLGGYDHAIRTTPAAWLLQPSPAADSRATAPH